MKKIEIYVKCNETMFQDLRSGFKMCDMMMNPKQKKRPEPNCLISGAGEGN